VVPWYAARMIHALLLTATLVGATPSSDAVVVLKAARMFDARAQKIVTPGLVVVRGAVIEQVGGAAPANATETIDLGDATLMPGMLDAHTHLTGEAGDWKQKWIDYETLPVAEQALYASTLARRTLEAGVTTVRNLGASDFVDKGLRDGIAKGYVVGPTVLVSLDALGTTGGHCDGPAKREDMYVEHVSDGVADGPDALRAKVRRNAKHGADVIKVCATGGVLSMSDDVKAPQVTQEEMNAIVDEAHTKGLKVAVHAHGAEGAKRAIRAGADSIEHATFLDDEALRMMKSRGTWLVPTLMAFQGVKRRLDAGELAPPVVPKAKAALAAGGDTIKRAIKMKVKIAMGTDAGVYPHGENAKEIGLLVDAGMPPLEALATATIRTAELLGVDARTGSLDKGKAADIIAVPGDPSVDVRTVERVRFVMKGGAVVKR
jgi:imidazolonepropionase-like amidohydrolase